MPGRAGADGRAPTQLRASLMGALRALLGLPLRYVNSPARLLTFGEKVFKLAGFRTPARGAAPPRRIVVIKLDRLGDLTLCGVLLHRLRRAWPSARITLIVRDTLIGFAKCHPAIDEVVGVRVLEGTMTYDFRAQRYGNWSAQLRIWLEVCRDNSLWQRKFDMAVVARWDVDLYGAVALAYLSGAPVRWGVCDAASSIKSSANRGFEVLLTNVVQGTCGQHELVLNRSLAESITGVQDPAFQLTLRSPQTDAPSWGALNDAGVDLTKSVIAVAMGASEAFRRWPVARYAALFREVFDLSTTHFVTLGTIDEVHLGRELRTALGDMVFNLEGKIELGALPSTLSRFALYVGSDAGIMHIACAEDIPVLAISCHPADGAPDSAQSPVRFGPWSRVSEVVRPPQPVAPCRAACSANEPHCILEVSVANASAALRRLLQRAQLDTSQSSGAGHWPTVEAGSVHDARFS
jgi:ADP-heptose:LPS heptosyltransferase